MKKITILLLAVLIFYVPCMTAYAETPEQKGATISAAVPATHVITFISSGGRIEDVDSTVGGHKEYGRRSEQPFHIIPDDGKEIDKVLYGGEDVTSKVKDGYFTTPPLVADMVFEEYTGIFLLNRYPSRQRHRPSTSRLTVRQKQVTPNKQQSSS